MADLLVILVSAIFVNNFVLARFLGICPFLGVSKKVETALGMGMAVTFVMTVATVVTWFLQYFILIPFGIEYLQTIAFILVIASLVQLVEMVVQKVSPVLYQSLGPVGADKVVSHALEELAVTLARASEQYRAREIAALRASVRSLVAVAQQVGMTLLARVGRDVLAGRFLVDVEPR